MNHLDHMTPSTLEIIFTALSKSFSESDDPQERITLSDMMAEVSVEHENLTGEKLNYSY